MGLPIDRDVVDQTVEMNGSLANTGRCKQGWYTTGTGLDAVWVFIGTASAILREDTKRPSNRRALAPWRTKPFEGGNTLSIATVSCVSARSGICCFRELRLELISRSEHILKSPPQIAKSVRRDVVFRSLRGVVKFLGSSRFREASNHGCVLRASPGCGREHSRFGISAARRYRHAQAMHAVAEKVKQNSQMAGMLKFICSIVTRPDGEASGLERWRSSHKIREDTVTVGACQLRCSMLR